MEENLIYGRKPAQEYLNRTPEKVEKIYIRDSLSAPFVSEIASLASAHRIPVVKVPGRKLMELVGNVNDQGIVLMVSGVSYLELEDWLPFVDTKTQPFIVILDELDDVSNFGAILRTAAAAGAAAVIVPKHRNAPVTAAVMKTSAGTAGLVPIIRVTNLNQAIRKLQDSGFWLCGLDQKADHLLWETDLKMALGIVIGNEAKGIREKTLELCDLTVRIPMKQDVESLNASVSAALVCYEAVRQRMM